MVTKSFWRRVVPDRCHFQGRQNQYPSIRVGVSGREHIRLPPKAFVPIAWASSATMRNTGSWGTFMAGVLAGLPSGIFPEDPDLSIGFETNDRTTTGGFSQLAAKVGYNPRPISNCP